MKPRLQDIGKVFKRKKKYRKISAVRKPNDSKVQNAPTTKKEKYIT